MTVIVAEQPFRFRDVAVSLTDAIRSEFEARKIKAEVRFGERERAQQTNQGPARASRVVVQPWDDNGDAGEMMKPSSPGWKPVMNTEVPPRQIGSVRAIDDWERLVIVNVWAVDPAKPNDAEAQAEATSALFELVMQAIRHARSRKQVGEIVSTKVKFEPAPIELSFGRELRLYLTMRQAINDIPLEVTQPSGAIEKVLQEAG